MKSLLRYILLLTHITTILVATSSAKQAQRTFSDWEGEWATIYQNNDDILNNPEKLSAYFIQAIEDNGNVQPLLENLGLKKPFLFGASSSSYQVEGGIGEENSWTRFAESAGKAPVGNAINFWNQYDEDATLLGKYNFGLNAIRISIEWSRIQPQQGVWNLEPLEHYKKIIRSHKKNGLA